MSVFEQYTIYVLFQNVRKLFALVYCLELLFSSVVTWNSIPEVRAIQLCPFIWQVGGMVRSYVCVLQLHFWERSDFVTLLALVTNSSGLLWPPSESPSPALRFNFSKIIFSCYCMSLIDRISYVWYNSV